MVKDHRGDCYTNTFEMCNAWGVDYRLFTERRQRGCGLMRSLITPSCEGTTIFDHEGNIFENEAAMCENWGISQPAYVGRRKRGWSVQDALTIPVMKTDDMHKVIEIVEQYEPEDVIRAISEYKERHGSLRRRNRYRKHSTGRSKKPVRDHLGHSFLNKREMCRFWKQDYQLFHNRDMSDWPMEYALTYPKNSSYVFHDHNGNDFLSIAKMCNYYDIDKAIFKKRMDNGWTLKDALTLPAEMPIAQRIDKIS